MSKLGLRNFIFSNYMSLICYVALVSCDFVPNGTPVGGGGYLLRSHLIKNLDLNSARGAAWFRRSDSTQTDGPVTLNGLSVYALVSGVYETTLPSSASLATGVNHVYFYDKLSLVLDVAFNVADTFSITNISPNSRIYSGGTVVVNWTGSVGADGYVLATVKKNAAYADSGYASFVDIGANAGALPPDAFSVPGGAILDTGWYYIYVYAYTGSPLAPTASQGYPTILPDGFSKNLSLAKMSGYYGSTVIARRDSVQVVSTP